ncbi:MAG TPA: tetratricopeptide repeat protein [Solirubrobacteraceae bacterium]|nr:tetratricopeptide repeat protein [Solirubrobacteraceae bacterium]
MSGHGEAAAGNLPVQLTRLVGRDADLGELRSLVWRTRVLTLCGPGGAGKTRLAMGLADAMRPDFIGGAWWVDLSTTLESELVPQVVAATVLEGDLSGDPAPAALARQFPESTLLALDNCEQVVDGCAELIVALLERSQTLRVIATSRQPLGIPGEQVWRVAGLDGEDGAVDLFVERAREATTSFDANAPGVLDNVRRICEWLDGMPLAIELAAARVRVLSVSQIAQRLQIDPSLLRHTARTAPERHRTMDAMLEWSHRMLEPAEQRLFRRLSVFRGSFSLTAAENVCAGYLLDVTEVLDLLAVLIDRSLVQVVDHPEEPRYRLLATVRQYAGAKLWDGPEGPTVHSRHAQYFLGLAVAARAGLAGPEQPRWIERLELEHDNLEAALQWLSEESIDDGARLARLLWPFWYQRGHYHEARTRFEQLLARAQDISPARRARVLVSAGEVGFLQCDYARAIEYLSAALELVRELGDERAAATALQRLGSIAREQARYDEARELHQRSLDIWNELGDEAGVAASHDYLGFVGWMSGDPSAGEEECAVALAAFKRLGDLRATATTLINLGACAQYRDELALARQRLGEALAIARDLGFQEAIAWALHELAIAERRARRPPREVAPMLGEALLVHRSLGDRWRVASVLEEIVGSLLVRNDPERGAEVLGATEALREQLGTPVPPAEAPDLDAARAALERRINAGTFASAWADGRARELDAVVDLALDALDGLDAPAATGGASVPVLTQRELAVLELLAAGHTNREIAASLYISPSTAGVHVSNILRKLGANRRVDAAGIAHKLGLLPTQ